MRYDWWSYVKSVIRKYGKGNTNTDEEKAVNAAIDATNALPDAEHRMKVISMVFWDRTHTIQGAADSIPCSWATAQRWQSDFIVEVAKNFSCNGLWTEKLI